MRKVAILLWACVLIAQAQVFPQPERRWRAVGVGPLASRPATCEANRDVYVCNGLGCTANGTYFYCIATNTWSEERGAGGGGGATLPFLVSTDYDFTPQTPGGTLTASTPAEVTLIPCPLGVAGANTNHYLYVSGGTGTAEAVLITGGTCTSGAGTGTVQFTPAYNHSGAWQIASATTGVQEAAWASAVRGTLFISPGEPVFYAPAVTPASKCLSVFGGGLPSTVIRRHASFATGNTLTIIGCSDPVAHIANLHFLPQNTVTSGWELVISGVADFVLENIETRNTAGAIQVQNASAAIIKGLRLYNYSTVGLSIEASTQAVGASVSDVVASGNPVATEGIRLLASNKYSIAGARLSNLNIATGVNMIGVYPQAGSAINEVGVSNAILDSWTGKAIALSSTGGTGAHYQFTNIHAITASNNTMGLEVGKAFTNVRVVNATIGVGAGGVDVVVRGGANVRVHDSTLLGGGAGSYGFQATTESGTPTAGLGLYNSVVGYAHDMSTSPASETAVVVDAAAHINMVIQGNRIYGSSSGLYYAGTGNLLMRDNVWVNTTRPDCAATLRSSTWTTESAAGTVDAYAICRKDAANNYAWVGLY